MHNIASLGIPQFRAGGVHPLQQQYDFGGVYPPVAGRGHVGDWRDGIAKEGKYIQDGVIAYVRNLDNNPQLGTTVDANTEFFLTGLDGNHQAKSQRNPTCFN